MATNPHRTAAPAKTSSRRQVAQTAAAPASVEGDDADADAEIRKIESTTLGSMLLDPAFQGGIVGASHAARFLEGWRPVSALNVRDALEAMIEEVKAGDMARLEAMLVGQAVAAQAMFSDLAQRAACQSAIPARQSLTQLALKAQAASRATIDSIVNLKNPRTATFIKAGQANVAAPGSQQQVNNGPHPTSHVRAPEVAPAGTNEVLALEVAKHGSTPMDGRTAEAPSRGNQVLAAVGEVNRPANRRGTARGRT